MKWGYKMPKNVDKNLQEKSNSSILTTYSEKLFKAGKDARITSFRITAIYLIIGCLWVLLSDKIVDASIEERSVVIMVNIIKGWFYIIATSIMIFYLVYAALKRAKDSEEKVKEMNLELEDAIF